jgi:DNA polymerase elongation subunit (family B)
MILLRGYDHGRRIEKKVKYEPILFTTTNTPTEWKALDGTPVGIANAGKRFDSMRSANEYVTANKHVSGKKIYGNTKYIPAFINDYYPGNIEFDRNKINVTTIDIEVASDDGFPEPQKADHKIISIAMKNNIGNTYYVWGLGEYDSDKSYMKDNMVVYRRFEREDDLLINFITHWSSQQYCPDVVTGWNTRFFDIPYLVNRINRMLGEAYVKRLSPWGMIDRQEITKMGRTQTAYELKGISQLDYLDLFKKFGYSYGPQESYKLDHIAHVVLGEKKLSYEEYSNLHTLYKNNHQKFIDYNIKDVELVDRIEDKLGLITLCMTMAYKGGVNYNDTFGTTLIWDTIIYRKLFANNIVVPFIEDKTKSAYPGGFVKEPQVGIHDNVVSFDLNSLYPSIIMQYNMSPETIANGEITQFDIENVLTKSVRPDNRGKALAANGQYFRTDKPGIIPFIIDEMYKERVGIKQEMITAQKELQKVDKNDKQEMYRIERDIAIAENRQMAIKILLNSLYGALGNRYFRFFDQRIAEAITLTGQLTIRWAEYSLNAYLNKVLKTSKWKDFVIAIDTDSLYVCLDDFVQKFKPENTIDFLDKVCSDALEVELENSYSQLYDILGGVNNRMVMKREAIADRALWTAKKRYIMNVHDNEGVRYAEPKLKIMGIEAIKSSTPEPCRDALKEIFKVIMEKDERSVQEAIEQFKNYFKTLDPDQIAFPRGVTQVKKFQDRNTLYKKGTPIHVRGAILYNKLIGDMALSKKYELINNGEKIKFLYLRQPNSIHENVIAFPSYLPDEFGLRKYIDHELQFQKTFLDPIEPVLEAIGWTSAEVASLEDFFG